MFFFLIRIFRKYTGKEKKYKTHEFFVAINMF